MTIDFSTLRDLPTTEKLRLVTQLWDDIASSSEPVVVPAETLEEATRRSKELQANPDIAIDEEELWRRVDG